MMKKSLALILALIMLFSTTAVSFTTFAAGETEIGIGETKTVTIETAGSSKTFKFKPEETGSYTFKPVDATQPTRVNLKDANGNILSDKFDMATGISVITYDFVKGATYFFDVYFMGSAATGDIKVELSCNHSKTVEKLISDPQCTVAGKMADVCEICEATLEDTIVKAPSAHVDKSAPFGTCDICNKALLTDIKLGETKDFNLTNEEIVRFKLVPVKEGEYRFDVKAAEGNTGYKRVVATIKDNTLTTKATATTASDKDSLQVSAKLDKNATYYLDVEFYEPKAEYKNLGFEVFLGGEMKVCDHAAKTPSAKVDSTCIATGFTEGYFCPTCGNFTEGHAVIPKKEHLDEDADGKCDTVGCGIDMNWTTIELSVEKTVNVAEGKEARFRFIPAKDGVYSFSSLGEKDIFGVLYNENDVKITDDDNSGTLNNFAIIHALEAGKTYYFGASFKSATEGGAITVLLDCTHAKKEEMITKYPTCKEEGEVYNACVTCGKTFDKIATIPAMHIDKNNDGNCDNEGCVELVKAAKLGIASAIAVFSGKTSTLKYIPAKSGQYHIFTAVTESHKDDSAAGVAVNSIYDADLNKLKEKELDMTVEANKAFENADVYDLEAGKTYYIVTGYTAESESADAKGYYDILLGAEVDACDHESKYFVVGTDATCTEEGSDPGYYCPSCLTWRSGHDVRPITPHPDADEDGICDVCSGRSAYTKVELKFSDPEAPKFFAQTVADVNAAEELLYKFTPEKSGEYVFYSEGNTDTVGTLYKADKTYISSSDDDGNGTNFKITATLTAGTTYYLGARFKSAEATGEITVKLECNHAEKKLLIAEYPTCSSEGQKYLTCTTCGDKETEKGETIPPMHLDIAKDKVDGKCDSCGIPMTDAVKKIAVGEMKEYNKLVNGKSIMFELVPAVTNGYRILAEISKAKAGGAVKAYFYDKDLNRIPVIEKENKTEGEYDYYKLEAGKTYYVIVVFADDTAEGFYDVTVIGDSLSCKHENREKKDKVEPTCVEVGYEAGERCIDCATWVSGHQKIDALPHTYNAEGYCSVCKKSFTPVSSGLYGDGVNYAIYEDGVMILSGNAEYDYDYGYADNEYNISLKDVKHIIILGGVTELGREAFMYEDEDGNVLGAPIKEILIPVTLRNISEGAFIGCDKLEEIKLEEPHPNFVLNGGALYTYDKYERVLLAYPVASEAKSLEIDVYTKKIGEYALYGAKNLENVTIPGSVNEIGDAAFLECVRLKEISVPNSVKYIGYRAFAYCLSLVSATLPEKEVGISGGIFEGCISLKNVTLPKDLKTIPGEMFALCVALESINLPEKLEGIDNLAFAMCVSLKSIVIPATARYISYEAFLNCVNLKDLTIYAYSSYVLNSIVESLCADIESKIQPSEIIEVITSMLKAEFGMIEITEAEYNRLLEEAQKISNFLDGVGHDYSTLKVTAHDNKNYAENLKSIGATYVVLNGHNLTYTWSKETEDNDCWSKYASKVNCSACGLIAEDVWIAGDYHETEIRDKVDATCAKEGYTGNTYCKNCSEYFVEGKETPKLTEHIYDMKNPISETKPTCTKEGEKVYSCPCGKHKVEKIPATGHKMNGNKCSVCDYVCSCNCHSTGITKFFFSIILFFQKLFGSNKTCACGIAH